MSSVEYDEDARRAILGATIREIWWSDDQLSFNTDKGWFNYTVEGDCCSHSYFFDFYGVELLLAGHPVDFFDPIELVAGDPGYHDCRGGEDCKGHEDLKTYGWRFTVEDTTWGMRTAVFSFRNESNGYYGGWLEYIGDNAPNTASFKRITTDLIGDA